MFREFFSFEIKLRLKRLSTYVYTLVFFGWGMFCTLAFGGAIIDAPVTFQHSGEKVFVNSPFVNSIMMAFLPLIGLAVLTAIMCKTVNRDFEHDMVDLFYTKPISKWSYLGGRFTGSFVVLLVINAAFAVGSLLGCYWPWIDKDRFTAVSALAYAWPFLIMAVPAIFFLSAIFFAVSILTRKLLPAYAAAIILFIGYMFAENLFISDLDNKMLASLLDPFGIEACGNAMQYWTIVEKNFKLLPLSGALLYNRLLWVAVGLIFLGYALVRFKSTHFKSEGRRVQQPAKASAKASAAYAAAPVQAARLSFSPSSQLRLLISAMRYEFFSMVKSLYFAVIVLGGLLLMINVAYSAFKMFGTTIYPVTRAMVGAAGESFGVFILIFITVYAGELVWRERSLGMHQMTSAMPVPDWLWLGAKGGAMVLMIIGMLLLVMLFGISFQTINGYYRYEIGLYLERLFGFDLVDYTLLIVLALFVHTLVNNKYFGHLIMIVFYLTNLLLPQFGLEQKLFYYGSDPGLHYSDMNGFGHYAYPYLLFKAHWGVAALVLLALIRLLWVRGTETGLLWRLKLARQRFSARLRLLTAVLVLLFIGTGSYIYYNTNVLNHFYTSKQRRQQAISYERQYKATETEPQPRITDVRVDVDMYPETRNLHLKGTYKLVNKHAEPVTTVYLALSPEMTIAKLEFDRPSDRILNDVEIGYYGYRLAEPLAPGETAALEFDLSYLTKGFRQTDINNDIVGNGTFFHNTEYMPSLGYQRDAEVTEDLVRKHEGLPPRERMADPGDMQARQNTYVCRDADWINFETVVSTTADQIAIAPGYLQRTWDEYGRRYFHYKMDAKILNYYAFLSARYQVFRDQWHDIAIEIYYQPGHEFNLKRMVKALKRGFDYYTANFSPYQHRQIRILEFPGYHMFAQSFPNTIPYSESIGFIAKVDDTDEHDIDYPFYVTAHELAHQWWAHQVIGADVRGSTLLSESMSQYSALMVMEKAFSRTTMKRYLAYELDRYLSGRGSEPKKELPLLYNENQQYIHYHKGSLVMYALRDYIGEEALNAALASYIKTYAYQGPPYTTSVEFLQYLKAATPEHLQYVLEDMFETITLYQNRAVKASYKELPDGGYEVHLTAEAQKLRADALGNEHEMPLSDWIDVGVLGERDEELYLQKQLITGKTNELVMTVAKLPVKAGIDPYNKLIDRIPSDNVVKVEKE